jgi:hypothetical protein
MGNECCSTLLHGIRAPAGHRQSPNLPIFIPGNCRFTIFESEIQRLRYEGPHLIRFVWFSISQVWDAISELRESGDWVVNAVPRFYLAFEPQLAAGNPHRVLRTEVPEKPPGIPSSASPSEVSHGCLRTSPGLQ